MLAVLHSDEFIANVNNDGTTNVSGVKGKGLGDIFVV
jgi:hypothetical protein